MTPLSRGAGPVAVRAGPRSARCVADQRWVRAATRASRRHGLLTLDDAVDTGLDRRTLQRAVSSGRLERLHPQVFRFAGTPTTHLQRVHAATLHVPDSRASHESALFLHAVPRLPKRVAVTVAPDTTATWSGMRVHRLGDLQPAHCEVVDGILTTTLARAVVDVSSVVSRGRLVWLIDRLTITDRRTSVVRIARVLRQVNTRGRRNIAILRDELDRRGPAAPAPRSVLEREIDELLLTTDLPPAIAEYPLPSGEPGPAFVDRAWPEARLILEIDGRPWHARERDMAKDRARDRAAARLGWLTLRVLDEEVRHLPELVIDDVVEVYRERTGQRPIL